MKNKSFKERLKENWLFRIFAYPFILFIVIMIYFCFSIIYILVKAVIPFKDAYDIIYTKKYNHR